MNVVIRNAVRFIQKVLFDRLFWGKLSVSDVDLRYEWIREQLYIEGELKTSGVNFFKECGSQRFAMEQVHKVMEAYGVTAPLFWATHTTAEDKHIIAADCIVQDYLVKGRWIHDGNRTVRQFMDHYILPKLFPGEAPHCYDCISFKKCIFNGDCDEDEEQACPLFERKVL